MLPGRTERQVAVHVGRRNERMKEAAACFWLLWLLGAVPGTLHRTLAFSPPHFPHLSRHCPQSRPKYSDTGSPRRTMRTVPCPTTPTTRACSACVTACRAFRVPGDSVADQLQDSYDVIVVGSGIGGLTAGAMLAKYGYSVVVLESHDHPGGAAHGFSIRDTQIGGDFHFDTGPSFFSGLNPDLPARASNPMRTVLDALDEGVPCVPYDSFGLLFPEGNFLHTTGFGQAGGVIEQVAGQKGVDDWRRLMKAMEPLAEAVDAMPTAALRTDAAAVFTTGPFLSKLASLNPLQNLKLTTSFQRMVRQAKVKSPFVQQWLDLLCFCLSGLPADGTITAEMALMLGEFYRPTSVMDTPVGGAFSLARALVRGLEKYGGTLACRSHVDRIDVDENGRAIGVTLRKNGRRLIATQAVISNMSVWDLYGSGILNVDAAGLRPAFVQDRLATPVGKSFMHLHVGFRATRDELATLQAHYMHMEDWSRGVTADQNAVLVSIPSVHDDTMAPDGYAVLHAYTPATEDYARWAGLDRKSMEYGRLKLERSQFLWNVLERIMPDIRQRAVHVRVGTPLTHERFLRRHEGSYGPALHAERDGSFPWAKTPVDGLLTVGDSNFPGIGVPAVAGAGLIAAHSVSLQSLGPQIDLVLSLREENR